MKKEEEEGEGRCSQKGIGDDEEEEEFDCGLVGVRTSQEEGDHE